MSKIISETEFVEIWQNAASLDEVALLSGIEARSCTIRAGRIRAKGIALEPFRRGPRKSHLSSIPISVSDAMRVVIEKREAVSRAKADLLVAEADLAVARLNRPENPEIAKKNAESEAAYHHYKAQQDKVQADIRARDDAFCWKWNAATSLLGLGSDMALNMNKAVKLRQAGRMLKEIQGEYDPYAKP